MKQTINYTNSLSLFDSSKIPLEQQICLLKANEKVKAKAMVKQKKLKPNLKIRVQKPDNI